MIGLYEVAVPPLLRYLAQLELWLGKLEALTDGADLLDARLAPDMFGFADQVKIAIGFSQRTLAPLCPALVRPIDCGTSLEGLRRGAGRARERLVGLAPADLDGRERETVGDIAGESRVTCEALTYVTAYGLPNFLFHLTSAYAIARSRGYGLGKGDFDGWHSYPAGFSFVGEGGAAG